MAGKFDNRALIDTPSYSTFDLSYRSRLTAIMGQLIPVMCKEIVPGDHFDVGLSSLVRLAPLQAPVFDDCRVDFHAFFVQNRIIDPRWKEFITGGVGLSGSNDEEISPLLFSIKHLTKVSSEHQIGSVSSLSDYLNLHFNKYNYGDGKPSVGDADYNLCAYPFLGYQKIYDDWFRNERIQEEQLPYILENVYKTSRVFSFPGDLVAASHMFMLRNRNYAKDKYTTALPEPVIGGPVLIPGTDLNGRKDVRFHSENGPSFDVIAQTEAQNSVIEIGTDVASNTAMRGSLFVDIVDAASATIQQLKTAFKMYSFFMKDTYNGNRYVEFIESHFNKRVPDATLDRALYLGKISSNISFGEVFQTSEGDGSEGQGRLGNYAGRGVGANKGRLFNEEFLEHGYIYVIMSIVPRATYFQGVDKKFIKNDRFDFFFPEFQDIGDDIINTMELYNDCVDVNIDEVFGYQSRWHEYKQYVNELHGDFLTNMRFWTLSREFSSKPKLGSAFSEVKPVNNPFVQIDEFSDNYLIDLIFHVKASRPMKFYESF